MSNSSEQPWSNNPNAPQISSELYTAEKYFFDGHLAGVVFYGIVVALFFRCIGVLLSPVNPMGRGVKWALIAHTVAMFSLLTTPIAMVLHAFSIMYIDDREFPGNDELPPGPIGYDDILALMSNTAAYNLMFPLNQWLADGLLMHRCYAIYSMNYWAMAFPCLLYLASVAMGIAQACMGSGASYNTVATVNVNTSYFAICLSLNVILTSMIVTRLIMHRRNLQKTLGASNGASGLYKDVIGMLVESYALYAAALLVYTVTWATGSWVTGISAKIVGPIQVIAPYLIILRVANRRASTKESIAGTMDSIQFKSQATTVEGDGSLPDGDHVDSMWVNGGPGVGTDDVVQQVPS